MDSALGLGEPVIASESVRCCWAILSISVRSTEHQLAQNFSQILKDISGTEFN